MLETCTQTAGALESYIRTNMFDSQGIMYSGIDSHTDKPFDRAFITAVKVPRRAAFDPWGYWTYEDSVMGMGLYIDALIQKYEVTGEARCIEDAAGIWDKIKLIYSCSQAHALGSFLRPYGGLESMSRFLEPLGTDQASPLFSALYRFLPHAEPRVASEIRRMLTEMLEWYERQGFEYLYYKSFIHSYRPDDPNSHHANSYYLPAIAWAASLADDPKWEAHLNERLAYWASDQYVLYRDTGCQPAFCWASDFDVLKQILGPRFDEIFDVKLLDAANNMLSTSIESYSEVGTCRRICHESAEPGFKPYVDNNFDPGEGMGFAYFATHHHGRSRPRHEIDLLLALAAVGYGREDSLRAAGELLALRKSVPEDFTAFLSEDYHLLPETVHLYARSVGIGLIHWWRNYWFLRRLERDNETGGRRA